MISKYYRIKQISKMLMLKNFVLLLSLIVCQVIALRIGAFNIQIFGKSKSNKEDVMAILVRILSRYDIVLIQEIRDASGEAIKKLLNETNEQNTDNPFSMIISERLGRSTSKEQYAYFYREKMGLSVVSHYVYDDGDEDSNTANHTADEFEREPYIVLFRSTSTILEKFAIAGIHVSPDKAVQELQHLGNVSLDIQSKLGVSDFLIIGDMNADCRYVTASEWEEIPLKNDSNYDWLIGDDIDTTVSNTDCAYDRFIAHGDGFKPYPGGGLVNNSATVFKFDAKFNLTNEFALDVSDHYPVELQLRSKDLVSCSAIIRFPVLTVLLCQFIYIL